jgi:hypothetical protein
MKTKKSFSPREFIPNRSLTFANLDQAIKNFRTAILYPNCTASNFNSICELLPEIILFELFAKKSALKSFAGICAASVYRSACYLCCCSPAPDTLMHTTHQGRGRVGEGFGKREPAAFPEAVTPTRTHPQNHIEFRPSLNVRVVIFNRELFRRCSDIFLLNTIPLSSKLDDNGRLQQNDNNRGYFALF